MSSTPISSSSYEESPEPSALSFSPYLKDDKSLDYPAVKAGFDGYKKTLEEAAGSTLTGRVATGSKDAYKIGLLFDKNVRRELQIFAALDLLNRKDAKTSLTKDQYYHAIDLIEKHIEFNFDEILKYCDVTNNLIIVKLLQDKIGDELDDEASLDLFKLASRSPDLFAGMFEKNSVSAIFFLSLNDSEIASIVPKKPLQDQIKNVAVQSLISLEDLTLTAIIQKAGPHLIKAFMANASGKDHLFELMLSNPFLKKNLLKVPELAESILEDNTAPWELRMEALKAGPNRDKNALKNETFYRADIRLHIDDFEESLEGFRDAENDKSRLIEALSLLKYNAYKLTKEETALFDSALSFLSSNEQWLKELVVKEPAIAAYIVKTSSSHIAGNVKFAAASFLASIHYEDPSIVVIPHWHRDAQKVAIIFQDQSKAIGAGGYGSVAIAKGVVLNLQTQKLKERKFAVKTFHSPEVFEAFLVGNEALKATWGEKTSSKELGGISKVGHLIKGEDERRVVYSAKTGDLIKGITSKTPLTPNQLMMGLIGVADGMRQTVQIGLVNADVKLDNILFESTGPLARMTWIDHDGNFLLPPTNSTTEQREAFRKQFPKTSAPETRIIRTVEFTPKEWYIALRENVKLLRQVPEISNYDEVAQKSRDLSEKIMAFEFGIVLFTAFTGESFTKRFNPTKEAITKPANPQKILNDFPATIPAREKVAQLVGDLLSLDPKKTPPFEEIVRRLEEAAGTTVSTIKENWKNRPK